MKLRVSGRRLGALTLAGTLLGATTTSGTTSQFTSPAQILQAVQSFQSTLSTNGTYQFSSSALSGQLKALNADFPNVTNTKPLRGSTCFESAGAVPTVNPCQYGNVKSSTNVVLFGDSHMQQYLSVFVSIANARGWHLTTYIRQQCAAAESVGASTDPVQMPRCLAWRTGALAAIAAMHPDLIIYTGCYGLLPPTTAGAQEYQVAQQLISSVKNHVAANVVSIVDVLKQNYGSFTNLVSGATCLVRNDFVVTYDPKNNSTKFPMADNPNVCYRVYNLTNFRVSDVALSWRNQLVTQDQAAGVTIIDPRKWICDTVSAYGMCPPVIDGSLVYFDTGHLSMSFTQRLTRLFADSLPS